MWGWKYDMGNITHCYYAWMGEHIMCGLGFKISVNLYSFKLKAPFVMMAVIALLFWMLLMEWIYSERLIWRYIKYVTGIMMQSDFSSPPHRLLSQFTPSPKWAYAWVRVCVEVRSLPSSMPLSTPKSCHFVRTQGFYKWDPSAFIKFTIL